jgi:hypothetical protein
MVSRLHRKQKATGRMIPDKKELAQKEKRPAGRFSRTSIQQETRVPHRERPA